MIEFRQLNEADAAAFWTLRLLALQSEPQAFRESAEEHRQKPVSFYEERLRSGGETSFLFGAFDGPELIGTAGLYRNKPRAGCVWGMFLDQRYRGRGVGKQLLQTLLRYAGTLPGLQEIHLTVAPSQQAAREVYLRCGFHVIADGGASACGEHLEPGQELMVLALHQA